MLESFFESTGQIDHISLNFNEQGLLLMNIGIAFIMFGVALGIKVRNFTRVLIQPKAVITGFIAQFFLLPAMTFLMVSSIGLPVSFSLGMLLVASCPGGNISNFITSLARGNVALSVSLTTISDLFSVLMTPLNFTFWAGLYIDTLPLVNPVEISAYEVFKTIFTLIILPIIVGMWFSKEFPNATKRINNPIKYLSILIFVAFIGIAIEANIEHFYKYIWLILPIVIIHNLFALSIGWVFSKLVRLNRRDRRTITIETGIQNSGIALIMIFSNKIFPEGYGGVAFITAWWGIWHIISGLILGKFWAGKVTKKAKLLPKLEDSEILGKNNFKKK